MSVFQLAPRKATLKELALLLVSYAAASVCTAQPSPSSAGLFDDFEGVQLTWQIPASDSSAGVKSHNRTDYAAHSGRRSEYIAVFGKRGGEQILATHPIPPSAAIREFRISLWVRGQRPGFQLMARVRLPRTLDDRGEPVSFYVYGDSYTNVGSWQELVVSEFDERVEELARVERISLGKHVDHAEAYVDQVAVNLFGGAGLNRVWLDDLSLDAAVRARPPKSDSSLVAVSAELPISVSRSRPSRASWIPRAITYRGEPFDLLKELGFNTILLTDTATEKQLAAARRLDMWLVCPAPIYFDALARFDRVMAWSFNADLTDSTLLIDQRIEELRSTDVALRPVLAVAGRETRDWSRLADIIVGQAHDHSSDLSSRWGTLGSPLVATSRWLPLRQQVWEAITNGVHGFVLQTSESLSSADSAHLRNIAELANLEIKMLRPWIAQRRPVRIEHRGSESPYGFYGLSNLHSAIAFVEQSQPQRGLGVKHEIEIPSSNHRDVFRVEPGGLSPVRSRRVAGGIRVSLDPAKPDGILLFTDRPKIIEATSRYLSKIGPRENTLLVDVLRAELLELDRRLQHSVENPTLRAHWRQEVYALHDRIAPLLDRRAEHIVSFRQLDHVLGQLERVHQKIR